MATKAVTFEFESDAITQYDLIIQKPNDDEFELTMGASSEEYELETGQRYVYLLRVLGNPGEDYKLTIEGPDQVRSPLERDIGDGLNQDTYLDDFTV